MVSPSGVYAVNTKMLGKRPKGDGNAEVTVDHTNSIIQFPDRQYHIQVDKLMTEAKCLSRELTSAIAQEVAVEPMLALPGWFIKKRIGRGPVFVINPVKPQQFFMQPNRQCLSADRIQQIAHQLEQLCRNVEPVFKEKKKWGEE